MKYFIILLTFILTLFAFLTWNSYIYANIDSKHYYLWNYYTLCDFFHASSTPTFTVLKKEMESDYGRFYKTYTMQNCNASAAGAWIQSYRPLVGDHIHLGYRIVYNGNDVVVRDHNLTQPIPYEDHPASCPNPPPYAYVKQYFHTGVHTHCDGIIHVHPWSAPKDLRKEGKEVTLGLWFESVGISVSSHHAGFRIPGETEYVPLQMAYYVNVTDSKPAIVTSDFDIIRSLWLVDHHGGVVLWNKGQMPKIDTKVLSYESHPINYPKRYL